MDDPLLQPFSIRHLELRNRISLFSGKGYLLGKGIATAYAQPQHLVRFQLDGDPVQERLHGIGQ